MDVVAASVRSWLLLVAGSVLEAGLTAPLTGEALDPLPEKINY